MKTQSQIIFVKNLPLKISDDDLYDIFWRYGTVIQIRKGINKEKRGSAIIVYENNESAKKAVEELNGFNVAGRFIVCYFYKININNKNKQIEIGI